jgi:uncharacterized membrane protein
MEYLPVLVHVAAGTLALASGAAALSVKKGARLHRAFGTVFFVAMFITAAVGTYLGLAAGERLAAFPGTVTLYLLVTAWATVRRHEGHSGLFEAAALVVAGALTVAGAVFGIQATNAGAAVTFYIFALVAALGGGGDLRLIRRGGLTGAPRVARHLWRMCAALLIAAFSFFIGQQKVMPEYVRGSPFLFVPPFTVLALMVIWLVYVRRSGRFKGDPLPS